MATSANIFARISVGWAGSYVMTRLKKAANGQASQGQTEELSRQW
jgi:hypothetical protein